MQFKRVDMNLEADYKQNQENLIKARDANESATAIKEEASLLGKFWAGATIEEKYTFTYSKLQSKKEFSKLMTSLLVLKGGLETSLDDFNAIDLDNTHSGDYHQLGYNAKLTHKKLHDLREEIVNLLAMYGKFHNHDSKYMKKYYLTLAHVINIKIGFA